MAINCSSLALAGINMDCTPSIGGIKKVFLARYSDIDKVTKAADDATTDGGLITAITLKPNAKWYEYQFRKNTGSLTSTLNINDETGNVYVTSELSLVFGRMENVKRIEMTALAVGQVVAVVLDSNGKYWYLGFDDYVSASAATGETGTAKDDRNAYTLTLSGDSFDWPYELSATAAAAVEASAEG